MIRLTNLKHCTIVTSITSSLIVTKCNFSKGKIRSPQDPVSVLQVEDSHFMKVKTQL